ncbi:Pkinase-domain-containing protein [Choiromyces venosus 120613-1]|uniref:non-specific serine/threonine protein kinase n=1 Tax=Choiromyces venosus 120613-1 TaxID=1336337 RepID=A0A3N4JJK8_9PEZI|nr:Pkinase-domain-containing protein [Choiromyces venosus 120613-1]
MEGDLNLSQALGGLRIANQTDDSPPPSPRDSGASNNSQSPSIHIPDLQQLSPQTTESHSPHTPNVLSQTPPLGPSSQLRQSSAYPPPTPPSRPTSQYLGSSYTSGPSTIYHPQNVSSTGSVSSINPLMYPDYARVSREPSRSSLSGPPSIGANRQSQRERSNTDRSYRQSGPTGPYPPRGSSRGMAQSGSEDRGLVGAGGPYTSENGPPNSSEEWKDRGAAESRILALVLAATDRTTLKEYAIKVLDKRHIIKEKKVKYVNIEKNTLNRLGEHPGVVRLYYTFQDERSLYFVLDLAAGGELLGFLKRMTTFDEECTRYYSAQILDTIEYMHSKGVIHRDLKPENVLLDDQMRVKITDFGTAKILDLPKKPPQNGDGPNGMSYPGDPTEEDDSKANSFVGTAEYVSPELLTDKAACKASDLWAFGCIVFQLLSGRPPFKAANEYQTFQKIVGLEYEFPKGFPPVAKDLVERLLVLDPAKRLNIEHIKNHEFFDGIEWGRKLWKIKAPRLKPYVSPPAEERIIKLNDVGPSVHRNGATNGGGSVTRPQPPRVITELPPPSQLDIEWSPVLTKSNERILKLGNAVVQTSPAPHSPDGKGGINGHAETPKKFARFFGGNGSKKRQRLVMITTCARVIVAAAGGDDKRMKVEINLQGLGVVARSIGGSSSTTWAIDTRDKTYTFEDPKTPASEWLETIDRAREIAAVNYPPDDGFMSSNLSSPASTITMEAGNGQFLHDKSGREGDGHSSREKSNKRFSKRNSRHGLAAVF